MTSMSTINANSAKKKGSVAGALETL